MDQAKCTPSTTVQRQSEKRRAINDPKVNGHPENLTKSVNQPNNTQPKPRESPKAYALIPIHLFGAKPHLQPHVTHDANKPGKFGHSSQARITCVRSFQLCQLPFTTNIYFSLLEVFECRIVSTSKWQKKRIKATSTP